MMSEQPQEERMKEDERVQQPTTSVEEVSSVILADGDVHVQKHQSTGALMQDTPETENAVASSTTEEVPPPLKKTKLAEPSRSLPAQDDNLSEITGPASLSTSVSPPDTTIVTTVDAAANSLAVAISSPNPPANNDTSASITKNGPDPSTKSSSGLSPPEALPLSAAAASSSTTSVSAKLLPSSDTCTDAPAIAMAQSSHLLPDYAMVRQTVHDMLALLQTYGPLTEGQLEYNLPSVGQHHHNNADDATFSTQEWKISDVLELLVALGLVQKVDHNSCTNNSTTTPIPTDPPTEKNADSSTTTTTAPATANNPPIVAASAAAPAQQYCVFGGVPRVDVVLPSDVMADITAAHREAARSWQRSRVLKKALLNTWSTKTVLEQLLKEFPEIGNDPVYRAALRNCHVSLADSTTASTKKSSNRRQQSTGGGSTKSKATPKSTAAPPAGVPHHSARDPSPASIAAVAAAKVVEAQKQWASHEQQATTSSNSPVATVPTPPVSTTTTLTPVPVPTAESAAPSTTVQPPPEAVAAAIKHPEPPSKVNDESTTKPEVETS